MTDEANKILAEIKQWLKEEISDGQEPDGQSLIDQTPWLAKDPPTIPSADESRRFLSSLQNNYSYYDGLFDRWTIFHAQHFLGEDLGSQETRKSDRQDNSQEAEQSKKIEFLEVQLNRLRVQYRELKEAISKAGLNTTYTKDTIDKIQQENAELKEKLKKQKSKKKKFTINQAVGTNLNRVLSKITNDQIDDLLKAFNRDGFAVGAAVGGGVLLSLDNSLVSTLIAASATLALPTIAHVLNKIREIAKNIVQEFPKVKESKGLEKEIIPDKPDSMKEAEGKIDSVDSDKPIEEFIKDWFDSHAKDLSKNHQKKLAVWLASRNALRRFPIVWRYGILNDHSHLVTGCFWAIVVSWVACNRGYDIAAAYAAYAAADAVVAAADADAVVAVAAVAVAAVAAVAADSAADAVVAAAAGGGVAYVYADAGVVADVTRADLRWLADKTYNIPLKPLPLWHSKANPLIADYNGLKRNLQGKDNNRFWQFFFESYDHALEGTEPNWEILSALAHHDAIEIWQTKDINKISAYIEKLSSK